MDSEFESSRRKELGIKDENREPDKSDVGEVAEF